MKELLKGMLKVAAVVVGIPVILWCAAGLFIWWKDKPSHIIDFRPVNFTERAERPFYYEVGDSLKFSDHIDLKSPTLLVGDIREVVPSPDGAHALVVANDTLHLVAANGSLRKRLLSTSSIHREPKPLGQQFIRDQDFKWSTDSRYIYFIRDEYYESRGSQLFSEKGELWEYDLASRESRKLVAPFRAFEYAVTEKGEVYFVVPNDTGYMMYMLFDDRDTRELRVQRRNEPTDFTSVAPPGTKFRTVEDTTASRKRISATLEQRRGPDGILELLANDRVVIASTRGESIKGPYNCVTGSGTFLPGNRYTIVRTYCENHSGNVLIDTELARYRTLPSEIRVFVD